MAVFRINKTDDYTVMSNRHLKERDMSLKAKGLLSLMLSLPDDWDYSIDGLISLCKENRNAVLTTLKELKDKKYLSISKVRDSKGLFEYVYNIFESPNTEIPDVDCPDVENPHLDEPHLDEPDVENHTLLNTNILNTNEINTNTNSNKVDKQPKRHYGAFKRVLLTDAEYNRLVTDYGQAKVDAQIVLVDEYIESNNNKNKYTNFNLVIRKSIRENWFNPNQRKTTTKPKTNEPEWLKDYVENFESGVDDL